SRAESESRGLRDAVIRILCTLRGSPALQFGATSQFEVPFYRNLLGRECSSWSLCACCSHPQRRRELPGRVLFARGEFPWSPQTAETPPVSLRSVRNAGIVRSAAGGYLRLPA